jgi:Phosphodiester glycosidase
VAREDPSPTAYVAHHGPGQSAGAPQAMAITLVLSLALVLAACGIGAPARGATRAKVSGQLATNSPRPPTTTTTPAPTTPTSQAPKAPVPLPAPARMMPLTSPAPVGEGAWTAAGRLVNGVPAVYETARTPPGGTQAAGIAWMDSRLLAAQLFSGSKSPGGGPYQFTAPVQPAQAATLVAAFNGGFMMNAAQGGYYTEGRTVVPLVAGVASLVIYANGSVTVGAWGTDVSMTSDVVAVRQNLVPLVAGGQPTAQATSPDWQAWGATCGVTLCSSTVPGIENQWRSGVGVTAEGALVYVAGPGLTPLQLAQLLVQAGVVRGMELDINPDWPVLATYDPSTPNGLAAPSNGSSLQPSSVQNAATFFDPAWARDFITMSAAVTAVAG